MDLQKLEGKLRALEQPFRERRAATHRIWEETNRKIGHNGYTEEDQEHEFAVLQAQLGVTYDLRNLTRPLLNEVIAAYEVVSAEERAAIRCIFHRSDCGFDELHYYVFECIECLETPADVDVFRLALIATSIMDCAEDLRDTHAVLAELALAAVKAGIVMEPACAEIAELSSTLPAAGGCQPMKIVLSNFPTYAPTATRLF